MLESPISALFRFAPFPGKRARARQECQAARQGGRELDMLRLRTTRETVIRRVIRVFAGDPAVVVHVVDDGGIGEEAIEFGQTFNKGRQFFGDGWFHDCNFRAVVR